MNVTRKNLITRAAALIALGAAISLNIAQAQPLGLSGVAAAERFRAVQEGAAAVKLLPAEMAQQVNERAPAQHDAAADKRMRDPVGGSVAADKRTRDPVGGSVAADKRMRDPVGGSVAADKRMRDPVGGSVAADKRMRDPVGGSVAADKRVKCCD